MSATSSIIVPMSRQQESGINLQSDYIGRRGAGHKSKRWCSALRQGNRFLTEIYTLITPVKSCAPRVVLNWEPMRKIF